MRSPQIRFTVWGLVVLGGDVKLPPAFMSLLYGRHPFQRGLKCIQEFKMAHGGARSGAGRKPGQSTAMNEEARKAALSNGISPLEFLLSVMRDAQADESKRIDAAKAAAPYVHARLSNVDMNATVDGSVKFERVKTGVPRD